MAVFPENPPDGGAVVWYLGHCGYAVRTRNHLLVFDTFDGAKSRFLNRGKKRRSVLTLRIPRASARGVEWVDEAGEKFTAQNLDFFGKFDVRAAFPMYVQAGGAMYLDFQKSFQAQFPGLRIFVPMKMGQKFVFENGKIRD